MLYGGMKWVVLGLALLADVSPDSPESCSCDRSAKSVDIPGTATITTIKPAADNLTNCDQDPVEVLFDFTADVASNPKGDSEPAQHLTVGDDRNPGRTYVASKGIEAGNTYRCIKRVYSDSVKYTFPMLDLTDFAMGCWKQWMGGNAGQ